MDVPLPLKKSHYLRLSIKPYPNIVLENDRIFQVVKILETARVAMNFKICQYLSDNAYKFTGTYASTHLSQKRFEKNGLSFIDALYMQHDDK